MCSRKHYVLVVSSFTKLQSLRSSPLCQLRQFAWVKSTLKARKPNSRLTGHYFSPWKPPTCWKRTVMFSAAHWLHTSKEIRTVQFLHVKSNVIWVQHKTQKHCPTWCTLAHLNYFCMLRKAPIWFQVIWGYRVETSLICNGSLIITYVCGLQDFCPPCE